MWICCGTSEHSPSPWAACRRCSALANARRDHREGQDLALFPQSKDPSMRRLYEGPFFLENSRPGKAAQGLAGLPVHRQGAAAGPSAAQWTSKAVLAGPFACAQRCDSMMLYQQLERRPHQCPHSSTIHLQMPCPHHSQSEDKESAAAAKLSWSGLRSA